MHVRILLTVLGFVLALPLALEAVDSMWTKTQDEQGSWYKNGECVVMIRYGLKSIMFQAFDPDWREPEGLANGNQQGLRFTSTLEWVKDKPGDRKLDIHKYNQAMYSDVGHVRPYVPPDTFEKMCVAKARSSLPAEVRNFIRDYFRNPYNLGDEQNKPREFASNP